MTPRCMHSAPCSLGFKQQGCDPVRTECMKILFCQRGRNMLTVEIFDQLHDLPDHSPNSLASSHVSLFN
jgi:hypothetical protein